MERDKLRIQLDSSHDDVERLEALVTKLRAERADLSRQARAYLPRASVYPQNMLCPLLQVDAASVAAAEVSQQRRRDASVEAALRSELSTARADLAAAQEALQGAATAREAAQVSPL